MTHTQRFLEIASKVALAIDHDAVERIVAGILQLREANGRLFFFGAGGSAANCSHAVNDFRKLCGIDALCPTDNVAELTARVNDDGWDTVFESSLKTSRAAERDAVFVMSVGGGDVARHISVGIIRGIEEAKRRGMKVYGIVGREDSYTKSAGDEVVVIPVPEPSLLTPLAEAFQAVVWHAIVSDPRVSIRATTW
jgi:D-sedoheptulose 7-phosphate isomerase